MAALASASLAAGCTRSESSSASSAATTPITATAPSAVGTTTPALPATTVQAATSAATTVVATTVAPVTTPAPPVSATPATFDTVPDDVVPGLESADAFCAAWSHFGGSFGIVAPIAAFGDEPAQVETLAAPAMVAAFDRMVGNWPAELEAVRVSVQVESLGPLVERLERSVQRLRDAGATDADVEAIAEAWNDVLEAWNPSEPTSDFEVSGSLGGIVADATAALEAAEQPFGQDPALVTPEVPEFNAYLTDHCPGQGTLIGDSVG